MGSCDVKVCRICFAMDCHLHLLHENIPLYKGYEAVTGLILANEEGLPPYLCTNCADQQTNYVRFMNKSLQAHLMLLDILKNHGHISVESIRDVIKTNDCGYDIEHTQIERTFSDFQIDMKFEDVLVDPIATECDDEIKIECDADDNLVGDEVVGPCAEEINDIILKEEVFVEATDYDYLDDSQSNEGDDGCLDDGLASEQEGKVKIVGARQGTEVSEYFDQRVDSLQQGTDDNKQVELSHGPSGDNSKLYYSVVRNESRSPKRAHRRHRQNHLGEDKRNTCDVCLKSFSNESNLRIHKQIHSNVKPFSCDVCKKSFRQKGNLKAHVLTHSDKKPHSCNVCKMSFRLTNQLRRHLLVHSAKPYSCFVCKKSFSLNIRLQKHMLVHYGVKPFSCDGCKKSFHTKDNLRKHIRYSGDRLPFYPCKICQKLFSLKCNLQRHLREHSNDKPFTCKLCKKSFSGESVLNSHMQSHSDDNPFFCYICKISFSTKGTLQRHMLIHGDEKPFTCKVCGKSFSRKDYLKCHMVQHAVESPFSCEVCKKSFRRNRNLRNHVQFVHSHTRKQLYTRV